MRILHIWDICNNSKYLTEKLKLYGHESKIVTRKKVTIGLWKFILIVIYQLLVFKADIIHINAWSKGIILAKIFSPRSKILMHYHGSDIRGKEVPLSVKLFANILCVSTRDLLGVGLSEPYWPRLLPVLVPDNFYYRGGREKGTTLELDQEKRLIDYELMPFVLSLFEFYRDKKRIKITSSEILSKTGMEAIQCGTKVIADSGEIVETFPMAKLKDYFGVYNELCCFGPSLE